MSLNSYLNRRFWWHYEGLHTDSSHLLLSRGSLVILRFIDKQEELPEMAIYVNNLYKLHQSQNITVINILTAPRQRRLRYGRLQSVIKKYLFKPGDTYARYGAFYV